MDLNFINRNNVDENFKHFSFSLIEKLEGTYSNSDLKKIKIENLKQLINDLESYKPQSHIRDEKLNLIKYLKHFLDIPISEHDEIELTKLESVYILSMLNKYLKKHGHTLKWAWLLTITLPLDIILWFLIGEYYFYIPIISIPYIVKQVRAEEVAKKNNRLW
ncbi:hypothetical protein [Psychroflexus sp. MES1-P1E]|uniref:hypothetical protein n=1 Tax=Psychroflexus sp. MES1-P1E TaxID=2058320 RepID=UPI000C7E70F4|nr:hypothetical protein [Psychroflexus sp. MES1-P1E]PKG42561.1 hypothetical protein CXF67_09615 [Psychroflexus sp. MES1-P1E]